MALISNAARSASYFVNRNSTGILTGLGVTGVITTSYLASIASIKANKLITREMAERRSKAKLEPNPIEVPPLTFKEKFDLVWVEYLPAASSGTMTILAIIMANRLASKEAAALAAAYGLSEKAFSEYKEKVVEKFGEGKERTVRDEIAQDRVNANPPTGEVIIPGTGEVLCYDILSGRYFHSTIEKIRKAENEVNYNILHHMYDSLSSFYDKIGLKPNGMSDLVGWNSENKLELSFSTTFAPDQVPCVAIDFVVAPFNDYGRLY